MTELVVALLMIVQGEIKEARIQESMSECLKGKRTAKRQLKPEGHVRSVSLYTSPSPRD